MCALEIMILVSKIAIVFFNFSEYFLNILALAKSDLSSCSPSLPLCTVYSWEVAVHWISQFGRNNWVCSLSLAVSS